MVQEIIWKLSSYACHEKKAYNFETKNYAIFTCHWASQNLACQKKLFFFLKLFLFINYGDSKQWYRKLIPSRSLLVANSFRQNDDFLEKGLSKNLPDISSVSSRFLTLVSACKQQKRHRMNTIIPFQLWIILCFQ